MNLNCPLLPQRHPLNRTRRAHRRRGSILIVAMWVMVALAGVALVLSRWARVESMAAANRVAAVQAAVAARAGEQYVLSQVEQAGGDSATLDANAQADGVPVGPPGAVPGAGPTARFWIMRPDREGDGQQDYGIDDEGSKVNINTASRDMLSKLPGMNTDIADAIIDWRDADENVSNNGAESEYYQSLQPAYRCKNGPFESAEELLLVRGVTPELLYGMDLNHNGFLDEEELAGQAPAADASENPPSPRGLLPFITTRGSGVAQGAATGGTGTGGGGQGQGQGQGQGGQQQQPNPGLININTAPAEVLQCLPGLQDTDAAALIAAREQAADLTNTEWVSKALTQQKAAAITNAITTKSYCYSADVVGVSDDGRAFHRVRVVMDASKSPPVVVYRRDLSGAGWPLGQDVRENVRGSAAMTGMAAR